jgi:tetratricopeptide (TPR) repeat protein
MGSITMDLQPGTAFGDYVLERRLGGGGFGEVWLARDQDGSMVAVKVLHGQYQSSEVAKLRAEIELLAAAASARSPHILRVLGGGDQPSPHVVMEYIQGVDLGREIGQRGALPVHEVMRIAESIADALAALQQAGIIHRDVKPANVMIDAQGTIKLTDFGIAKIVGIDTMTSTSQMPMSMAYAAPEAWDGHSSHLSDHYAFGALLYHCLTGRPVFGGSYAEIYRHHLATTPDLAALPPDVPPSLTRLIGQCLEKDASRRPGSAIAIQRALASARAELSGGYATVLKQVTREPRALGHWLIERRTGEGQPWVFECQHETTRERALVEVHFSDSLDYGFELRQALAVNPELVPFGAERLLGSSRLVLRPGEAWDGAPQTMFTFWVARETPPPAATPPPLSPAALHEVTTRLREFIDTATNSGLRLNLEPPNLRLLADGSLHIARPGLPPYGEGDANDAAAAFLRSLPLDQQMTVVVAPRPTPDEAQTTIVSRASSPVAPPAPPPSTPPHAPAYMAAHPVAVPATSAGGAGRRAGGKSKGFWPRYRLPLAGVAVAASIAAVVGAFVLLGDDPNGSGPVGPKNEDEAALATLAARPVRTHITQGETYYRSGDYEKAVGEYSEAIKLNPAFVNAFIGRGKAYAALGKNDLAISDYAKAIQLNPRDSEPYNLRGIAHFNQDRLDLAVSDYAKAIELDPNDPVLYANRANAYFEQARHDLAIADYNKAIELDPLEPSPYNMRGNVYFDLKRYPEALADYDKAIQIKGDVAVYHANRAGVLRAQNRGDLALASYSRAIELDGTYSRAYNGRGNVHYEARRYAEAVNDYSRAIELEPVNSVYHANRGLAYEGQARGDLARRDYERAHSLATNGDERQRAQSLLDGLR